MANLDPSSIISIMNIVLWVLFGSFFVLMILFFLRGLARGWRYGLYRLIAFAVFFIVALTTLRPIANAVGNWDMTSYNLGPWTFPLTVNETNGAGESVQTVYDITVSLGSPYSAISGAIEQIFAAYKVTASPDTIAAYANAVAQSLVLLVLLMVEAILMMTVVNLIVMLMWHILWKHFIPKEKRKASYKQGKIWSGFSDLVIGLVCCCMFIFPLTSVVNTLSYSYSKASDETEGSLRANQSTVDSVNQVVDAYENSAFAKTFFGWTRNQEGMTFDAALTNYFITGNYGDASVSFVQELSALTKSFTVALQSGLINVEGGESTSKLYLACSYYMPVLLESLSESGLLNGLAPYAFEVAANLDGIRSYISSDTAIDWPTLKLSSSFSELARLYRAVLDSGLASDALDENGNVVASDVLLKKVFNGDTKTPMEDLLNSFDSDDMAFFDKLVSVAAYCLAFKQAQSGTSGNGISISDFLPSVTDNDKNGNGIPDEIPESFLSMKWGHEIAVFYDCAAQFVSLDNRFFDACFNAAFSEDHQLDTETLYAALADHVGEVGEIFYGAESASSGKANAKAETTTNSYCFLDSVLLEKGLGKILTIVQNSLNSSFGLSGSGAIDLGGVQAELLDDDYDKQVRQMKTEFRSLFNIVKKLTSNNAGKAFLSDLQNKPGLYFDPDGAFVGIDDGLVTALADSFAAMDSSKLAVAFMPKIFQHFIDQATSSGVAFTLSFSGPNLGQSLSQIVTTLGQCQGLIAYVQSLSSSSGVSAKSQLTSLVGYSDQLLSFLNLMVGNSILNPASSKNSNLYNIVNTLLSAALGDYDADALKNAIESDHFSGTTEMQVLVKILQDVASNDVLDKVSEFTTNKNISSLDSIDFQTLFGDIDQSDILKSFLGSLLDKKLADSGLFDADDLSSDAISFTHITDWAVEGTSIAALVHAASGIGDLGNIDFLHSDSEAIAQILSILSQSPIFTNDQGTYLFSSYMSKKLVDSLSKSTDAAEFFADKGTSSGNYTFVTLKANITGLNKSDWLNESTQFGEMIYRSSRLGSFNALGSGDLRSINPDDIAGLLSALNASKAFANVTTYRIYQTMNQSLIDSGSTAFNNTNLNFLYTTDADGRELANTKLVALIHVLLDPNGVDASGKLTYALLDANGKINTNALTIENADANFVIKPLLKAMAESPVFNTAIDTSHPVTAFEAELSDVLVKSGLYGDKNSSTVQTNVLGYVRAVAPDDPSQSSDESIRYSAWDTEINQICSGVKAVENLGISDFASFDFASLFGGTAASATADEVVRAKVYAVLSNINASSVLYHALPFQLENAISNAGSSDFDLSGANSDYLSGQKYGDDELETLSYIFMESAAVKAIGSAKLAALDFTTFDIDSLSNMLAHLAQSHIFNSLKSTAPAGSLTVFQKNMATMLTKNSSLNSVYYSAANPKDAYNTALTKPSYTSASEKANYYVVKDLPAIALDLDCHSYGTSIINGGSGSLKAVLSAVAGESDLLDALESGSTSVLSDPSGLETILNALDQCDLLHDCVPNALAKFTGSSSSLSYGSVNFQRSNPYFVYWFTDTDNNGVRDSMLPSSAQNDANATYVSNKSDVYGSDEIGVISRLIVNLNKTQSSMSGVNSTNIPTTDTTTLYNIREVLLGLNDSYVFHLGGEWGTPNVSSWAADDLSVFEQVMYKLYSDIHLSDRAYLNYYDLGYANAGAKLHANIVAFNSGSLPTYEVNAGHVDTWENEIDALVCDDSKTNNGVGLLEIAKEQGLLTSGANFSSSSSGLNLTQEEPQVLRSILDGMNKVNVTQDAVPYSLGGFLNDSLNFKRYSEFALTDTIISAKTYSSDLGVFETFTLTSTSAPSFGYSYDGVNFQSLAATSSSGTTYSFDLTNYKPTYVRVTPNAATVVSGAFDTSDFADLTQANLKGDHGYIASVYAFVSSVYDPASYGTSNGGYINFRNDDDITHYLTSGADLSGVLDILSNTNGAYVQRFYKASEDSGYTTLTLAKGTYNDCNVLSRDITFANILKMPYSAGGFSGTLNMAKYLASDDGNGSFGSKLNPLLQAEAVFGAPSYNNQAEGSWLAINLGKAVQIEANYQLASTSANSALYLLSQLASGQNLSSLVNSAVTPVGTTSIYSAFGKRFAAGLVDSLTNLEAAYLSGGTYETVAVLTAPADANVNRFGNLAPYSRVNFYSGYAFSDLNADLAEAVQAMTTSAANLYYQPLSGATKTMTAAAKSAVSTAFASLDTLYSGVSGASVASNLGGLLKLVYEGSFYDWFVEREYYTLTNHINYHINTSGFTFATAANNIQVA